MSEIEISQYIIGCGKNGSYLLSGERPCRRSFPAKICKSFVSLLSGLTRPTVPFTKTNNKSLLVRMEGGRGGICQCRHGRRQCKIFASGVNFSIFTIFFVFFPTKTVEIR